MARSRDTASRRVTAKRRPDQIPGGRHGLTPERVEESQRGRILDAITEAVGAHGYHAARISEVIARAGVSRKTFYEHFEDKERCFIAAYERAFARLLTVTLEAFDAHDAWPDRLRAGMTALLSSLAFDPAVARTCFVEVLAAGPTAVDFRNEAVQGLAQMFDAGRLEVDLDLPPLTAVSMVGGISEIIYREVAGGRAEQLPDRVPELMFICVLPFLGPEAAAAELERPRRRQRKG